MIDKNKLFELFGSPNEKEDAQVLMNLEKDFLEKPFAKIGMFTKLIVNNWVFYQKLQQFLSKEQPNFDIEDTKRASDFTIYNRAWHYIKNKHGTASHRTKATSGKNDISYIRSLHV